MLELLLAGGIIRIYGFIGKKNCFCLRGRGETVMVMIIRGGEGGLNVRDWSFVGCVTKKKKKDEGEARRAYCI